LGQRAMEVLFDEMISSIPRGVHHILMDTVLRENHSLFPKT
jgi:hypothetical protein